jgi:hypothetical protein
MGEELLVENLECVGWEQVGAGGGAEDGVENDERDDGRDGGWAGGGLIPCCWISFRRVEGSDKTRYGRGDFCRAEHSDLDAGGGQVGHQVI